MKQFCISLFFIFSIAINGQSYVEVDAIVKNYPRFSKVENLATKIETDFSSDADKSRAAFFWLTQNIRYNLRELYNPKQRSYQFRYSSEAEKEQKIQTLKNKLVADAFAKKSGVCEEYAQAFKKICDLLNIEAIVIKGNVRNEAKEIGKIQRSTNHAWNAVKIDNNWLVLDATWAAGYENNRKWVRKFNGYFYDMPKTKIMKTHYPSAKIWQLRFGRMSEQEFYNQPIYSNTFLGTKTTLVKPKNGIINVSKKSNISILLNDLKPTSSVYYIFSGQRYLQKTSILSKGKTATVSIPNPQRNSELSIFIDGKIALQYKVLVN